MIIQKISAINQQFTGQALAKITPRVNTIPIGNPALLLQNDIGFVSRK